MVIYKKRIIEIKKYNCGKHTHSNYGVEVYGNHYLNYEGIALGIIYILLSLIVFYNKLFLGIILIIGSCGFMLYCIFDKYWILDEEFDTLEEAKYYLENRHSRKKKEKCVLVVET